MARELVLWYARIPLQHLYLSRTLVNGLLAITMSTYLPGPEEEIESEDSVSLTPFPKKQTLGLLPREPSSWGGTDQKDVGRGPA
jgi:hypothetical protein